MPAEWDITWGDSQQLKLPEFDVCWTSPPYEMDPLSITSKLHKVAKPTSLLWIMHPARGRVFSGWKLLRRCAWCMTESDVDKAYTAREPLDVMHDIGLYAVSGHNHYWNPEYWMPNWMAGGIIDADANYLPVPADVIAECLGASLPSEGKVFLDPFCGTATSVLTAHEMGFVAHGVEKDEQTCKQGRIRLKSLEVELPSEKHAREQAEEEELIEQEQV